MLEMNRAGQRLLMALVLGMLVQVFNTYMLAQAPQGLVSCYSFDTPGQPGLDSVRGNHGVQTGVTQVPGLRGLAASFANGWIDLPPSSDFDLLGGNFTLSVFINVPPGTGNRNWFTKANTVHHEYGLGGGAPANGGKVGILFGGGPGGGAESTSQPFDGTWHHVAGVKRGNQAEIWIDGVLEASNPLNLSAVTDFGQFAIGRDGACCQFFNGLMDEAKIWSKALSASEIAAEGNGCPTDTEGPLTSNVVVTPNPVAVNMLGINLSAVVDDSNSGNSIVASARYRVDGGAWIAMGAQDSDFNSVIENVTADIGPFSTADVKEICVQGTDAAGNTGPESCILLAIYDPTGGFVTGGGWINSPVGAYRADLTLTGKANFGFVSKYKKGASIPAGNTEFQFKTGNLNFSSTAYDWLVIAGARAQYKGTGTINGGDDNGSGYGFMLTAIDGQVNGGGGVDKFRMKIWKKSDGTIVYDNQVGSGVDGSDTSDPVTAVGGGSIVIHKN